MLIGAGAASEPAYQESKRPDVYADWHGMALRVADRIRAVYTPATYCLTGTRDNNRGRKLNRLRERRRNNFAREQLERSVLMGFKGCHAANC